MHQMDIKFINEFITSIEKIPADHWFTGIYDIDIVCPQQCPEPGTINHRLSRI